MKKLFCMIALGAITFGSVFAAAPVHKSRATMQTDTTKMKMKKKKMKMKKDSSKMMMKKDSTKM